MGKIITKSGKGLGPLPSNEYPKSAVYPIYKKKKVFKNYVYKKGRITPYNKRHEGRPLTRHFSCKL